MKTLSCILLVCYFWGCSPANESSVTTKSEDCSICPIQINTSTSGEQADDQQSKGVEANGAINADLPIAKKILNAELNVGGAYKNASESVTRAFWKISEADNQKTQDANLYRTVNCALLQIICEDKSLADTTKTRLRTKYILAYGEKIEEIVTAAKLSAPKEAPLKPNSNTSNEKHPPNNGSSTTNIEIKGDNTGQVNVIEKIDAETVTFGTKKNE